MADISLRAYLKEIDELIERDQLDEAISHARHILQNYPKHLDTYRLLGKSYLEAKRFGDAADIFQRVLSAVPDDFVSHIGMAIVREDEGNIDSAIWHMERAFETNPANPAIRQELSRLIGRRDGIEPHKIRLTRGALARQYAQGELYPQAIAELRSALQEDSDRPELEVLLAKMYWRAGQPKEARSMSEQILEKLPFSYEANRIMAALFEGEGQTGKAGEHHRRLAALEPYAAFSDSSSIDPRSVDTNAVRIDQLKWIPGQPLPSEDASQPDWVASLGVDLAADEVELDQGDDSPPWLTEIEHATPSKGDEEALLVEGDAPQQPPEPIPSGDAIPEWMKDAGWSPSTGESQEAPVSFSDTELDALEAGVMPNDIPDIPEDDGELAPAEIPNWLQDKAPPQADPEEVEQVEETEAAPSSEGPMPDWLSEIADEAEEVSPDPTEAVPQAEPVQATTEPEPPSPVEQPADADSPEVPSWIDDLSPGATSTIITWLGDRPEAEAESEIEPTASPEIADEEMGEQLEDKPTWVDESTEEPETPEVAVDPTPSWLAGVAEAASQQASDAEEALPPEAAEVPTPEGEDDWLDNLRAADAQAVQADEAVREGPDWLDGVSEPESSREEDDEPDAPDWLRGVEEPEEVEAVAAPPPAASEAPDWLQGGDELEPEPGSVRADVPDWLQGIADPGPGTDALVEEAPEGIAPAAAADDSAPNWLRDFAGEGETEGIAEDEIDPQAIQQIEAELSAATEPAPLEGSRPEGIGVEDELDDEEVFRWLESLADRDEGATATTPPSADAPGAPGMVQDAPSMQQAAPPEDPDASMQWLEDLATERGLDVDVSPGLEPAAPPPVEPTPETGQETGADEQSPDWLREMATAPSDETLISIPRPPIPEAPKPEQPPAEPTVEETLVAPATAPTSEAEVPDWLDEAASAAAEVPAEPTPEPPPPLVEPTQPTSPMEPEVIEPEQVTPDEVIPVPEVEAKPEKPKSYKEPPTEAEIILQGARQALAAGDAGRALSDYKKMINRKQELNTVIEDLEEALDRYPNLPTMWQALGDAYMKADRLAEAIQAYQRGMEVA
jgi:tetratricopeptide (TPR) repeat protein